MASEMEDLELRLRAAENTIRNLSQEVAKSRFSMQVLKPSVSVPHLRSVYVVSNERFDLTTYSLQIKLRELFVPDAGYEYDWFTIENGYAYECYEEA